MLSLILETFKPWLLVGLLLTQWFCLFAGSLMLLMALAIHSGLGASESLVFFVPAVFLTAVRRVVRSLRT